MSYDIDATRESILDFWDSNDLEYKESSLECMNNERFIKLMVAIDDYLGKLYPEFQDCTDDIAFSYADRLTKSWHGTDFMMIRAVNGWLKARGIKPLESEEKRKSGGKKDNGKGYGDPTFKDGNPKPEPEPVPVPKEEPKEEPKEIPKEVPKEQPEESPKEIPEESPKEEPKDNPDDKPEGMTWLHYYRSFGLPEDDDVIMQRFIADTGNHDPLAVPCIRRIVAGMDIAIFGNAGLGKTHLVICLAQHLGLPIKIQPTAIMPTDIMGYANTDKSTQWTAFTDVYAHGGLCAIEEMDRGEGYAYIPPNTGLANGLMDIPGQGTVKRHPDAVFIATMNTNGMGADSRYNTANQLDRSTLSRFSVVKAEWNDKVAKTICPDSILTSFCMDYFHAHEKNMVNGADMNYRQMKNINSAMAVGISFTDALESELVKSQVDKTTLEKIAKDMTTKNRYTSKFKEWVESL